MFLLNIGTFYFPVTQENVITLAISLHEQHLQVGWNKHDKGKRWNGGPIGGPMVSALNSGVSTQGFEPWQGKMRCFMGKTLYSHNAPLHPGV